MHTFLFIQLTVPHIENVTYLPLGMTCLLGTWGASYEV